MPHTHTHRTYIFISGVAADPYTWSVQSQKDMTVTDVKMTAPDEHWGERVVAQVNLAGVVNKNLTAGNVELFLWEDKVSQKVWCGRHPLFATTVNRAHIHLVPPRPDYV